MPNRDYYLPQRQLVSQQDTAIIEPPRVPRSKFTGSWTLKTAFDAGYLVPFMVEEVLPGDHLKYNVTAYLRMSTPLFPLFDNQRVDTFFFFIPNRLVWAQWTLMMGDQPVGPSASIAYTIPQLVCPVDGYAIGTLYDYMGLPTVGQITAGQQYSHSALPLRAYNLVWNEWFRDENLQNATLYNYTGNGPDDVTWYTLLRRAKSADYFTRALPWPQKFTNASVPLSGVAPVKGIGFTSLASTVTGPIAAFETGGPPDDTYDFYRNASATAIFNIKMDQATTGTPQARPLIFADLAQASGVTINQLRQSFLVQQLLERDARGGTRYIELLQSHFGVRSSDARLQRPEYIGGGQTPLQITPIAQTAPTAGVPLGALGAAGTAAGQHSASFAAEEHGIIIGLINVKSELSYSQGVDKYWNRLTRYDFYWPSLAQLGEQAILRKEIYATGVTADDDTVFGYQERWHEYRENRSKVTGIMRPTAAGTIDMWHLSQEFSPAPTLNGTFIADTPPMTRVLAAGSAANGQQYLADILIHRTAVRPIPTYGTPVTLGRF